MRTVEMRRGSLSNSTRMSTPRRAKREVNDWQGSKDLVGCLDHILSSEKMADIAIVFPGQGKNGVSINAHKLILAARSPVFEGMFYGTESKKNRYFEETDIPPGPFKVLLKFIYTDIADLTPDNVLHVLNASEKYKIPSLTQQCCHHLIPILSPETVCGVLETACTFRLQELQMRCYVYIDENAAKVLFTEGFKRLSRAVMAKVIKRRSLDVPELDVYKAVVAWAETEMKKQKLEMTAENRRRTIGDQFALLRIPCIPQQQFADHVVKDNLLTGEEILQVFMHYTDSDKKPMKFSTTKARSPGLIVAERYTSTKDITTADKGALTGKISIETNENLILLGIVVKGVRFKCLYEVSALSSVTGTIDTSCGKSKEKLTITIQRPDSSDKCSIENMYFDKPFLVEKGKQCDMDFSVTFGHSVKQLGQQEKDISLLYSIGIGAQDTFTLDELEVKFSKESSANGLQWVYAFIMAPFSD